MASPAAVRAAYLRKAKASHPDAGGTKQEFQTVQAAYERLGTQRKRQASIDQRYYARRPNDIIDRINHHLSRPLGNLVPTRYKIAFRLGAGEVIKGWDVGCAGMAVGERRQLFIPAKLGYGKRGAPPDIPPNADLNFSVELLKA